MAIIELTPPRAKLIELTPPTAEPITDQPEQPSQSNLAQAMAALIGLPGAAKFAPLQGVAELAGTIGTGAIAEPIAGIAGAAQALNPLAEEGAGTRAVKGTREALTFAPREAGQELIQDIAGAIPETVKSGAEFVAEQAAKLEEETLNRFGPLAATALKTLPVLLLEIIPGGFALKKARGLRTSVADEVIDASQDATRQSVPNSTKAGAPPEAQDYQTIADNLNKRKADNVAASVRPDQQVLDSAEALNVDLNPSHYSTNRAFIDVEQSLKDLPGSKLATIEQKAILDTGIAADNLIKDLGGTTDKSLLDFRVRTEVEARISDLETKADIAYKAVNDTIPAPTKVNIDSSTAYIQRKLDDVGGDNSALSVGERQLLALTEAENPPTYKRLDVMRRDIGDALGKRSGVFRDDNRGDLNQLYAVLSDDQQGIADAFGVGAEYATGRKLVFTRKGLEKEAITLFGKELAGSILPKLSGAAGALTKGDLSKFSQLMNALPANQRVEAAATMLNDLFTLGARNKGSLGQGFVAAFQGLNRNAGAKRELFKHLPQGAQKRFDDIGRVSTGIFNAKALENTSKTARTIVNAMNDGSLIGNLFTKAAGLAAKTPGVGFVARGAADIISSAKTPSTELASNLLTSPSFKASVIAQAAGNAERSERIIRKSSAFKRWLKAKPPAVKAEIAAIGFVPWLTRESDAP